MNTLVSLSTSICDSPMSAERILERWQAVSQRRLDHIALGASLPAAVQRELLSLLPGVDLTCAELGHPLQGPESRRAASLISEDREERVAASRQLSASVELAADHGVPRVVLYPQRLDLALTVSQIVTRYVESRPVLLMECTEERLSRGAAACDALCAVLDSVLKIAQRHDVELAFLGPPPWPHQVPNLEEVERLASIFDGAPLRQSTCVDWIYLEAQLRGSTADFNQPKAVMQLADACGLATNLPLGCGEIPWDDLVPLEEPVREAVLNLAPLTQHDEFNRGLDLLGGGEG